LVPVISNTHWLNERTGGFMGGYFNASHFLRTVAFIKNLVCAWYSIVFESCGCEAKEPPGYGWLICLGLM
jgi:hypothetical protein